MLRVPTPKTHLEAFFLAAGQGTKLFKALQMWGATPQQVSQSWLLPSCGWATGSAWRGRLSPPPYILSSAWILCLFFAVFSIRSSIIILAGNCQKPRSSVWSEPVFRPSSVSVDRAPFIHGSTADREHPAGSGARSGVDYGGV